MTCDVYLRFKALEYDANLSELIPEVSGEERLATVTRALREILDHGKTCDSCRQEDIARIVRQIQEQTRRDVALAGEITQPTRV